MAELLKNQFSPGALPQGQTAPQGMLQGMSPQAAPPPVQAQSAPVNDPSAFSAEQPQQQVSVEQDAVGFAMMLRQMNDEQKEKAWPKIVEHIVAQKPEYAQFLDPNKPPSNAEIDKLFEGTAIGDKISAQKEERVSASISDSVWGDKPKKVKMSTDEVAFSKTLRENAQSAEESLIITDRFQTLMKKHPDVVGPGSDITLTARQIGDWIDKKFGTNLSDDEKLAAQQYAKTLTMDFVVRRIQQSVGTISDTEMEKFEESVAGIEKTPAGNKLIVETLEDVSYRQIEKNLFFQTFRNKNGNFEGADELWEAYRDKYPIMSDKRTADYIERFKAANPDATRADAIRQRIYNTLGY